MSDFGRDGEGIFGNMEVWIVIFLRAGDFFDLYFDQSLSKMIIDRFE